MKISGRCLRSLASKKTLALRRMIKRMMLLLMHQLRRWQIQTLKRKSMILNRRRKVACQIRRKRYVIGSGTPDKTAAKRVDLLKGQKSDRVDVTLHSPRGTGSHGECSTGQIMKKLGKDKESTHEDFSDMVAEVRVFLSLSLCFVCESSTIFCCCCGIKKKRKKDFKWPANEWFCLLGTSDLGNVSFLMI